MRKYGIAIFLLTAVLSFTVCISQAEEDPAISGVSDIVTMRVDGIVIDGNMWANLTKSEKWTYLFGFEDGARDTAIHYVSDADTRGAVYNALPTSLGGGMSIKDLISRIDEFYSDGRNMSIPVNAAL